MSCHDLPVSSKIGLQGVEGFEYNVLNYINLTCKVAVGNCVHMQALVVCDMVEDVLLSWSDLVSLGIVSRNLPLLKFCCRSGNVCFKSVEEVQVVLLLEFACVFSGKLHGWHIGGEP